MIDLYCRETTVDNLGGRNLHFGSEGVNNRRRGGDLRDYAT